MAITLELIIITATIIIIIVIAAIVIAATINCLLCPKLGSLNCYLN